MDNISLGIPHGECFGLLGQNGAGKTTTFRMLTGDETITDGTAYVDSYNIRTNMAQVRESVSFWTPGLPVGVLCNHPCPSVVRPSVRGPWSVVCL